MLALARAPVQGFTPVQPRTTFMNAATPGATTLVPTTTAVELPAGLTDTDAARITAAISAARTESTRHAYDQARSQWERWCIARGLTALPGDPRAERLPDRARRGRQSRRNPRHVVHRNPARRPDVRC